ncbi:MAG TPA: hypothetical protein VLB05_10780 [Dongiaceae bacterium]|nr:hypothetical protein [Dongiaceae bacterium]
MSRLLSGLLDRVRRLAGNGGGDPVEAVRAACIDSGLPMPEARGAPLRLCYFMGIRNIGDLLSPVAVQFATGRPTIWRQHRPKVPHLLALGSILSWSTRQSHVWGAGILHPSRAIGNVRPEQVWALRGKLTEARLRREQPGLRDVPLGDPGYLVGRALGALLERPAARHRLGIVPHNAHRDHPAIARWRGEDGVVVLDVRDPEPAFFARMAACEAIASSSLHGLIFAEALGIPNAWVDFAPADDNRCFKYRDWFSLAARPQAAPLRARLQLQVRDLIAAATLHEFQIDERALRTAIPRAALDEVSAPRLPARRTRYFLTCRRWPLPVFLTTRNRGNRLRALIAAYRAQSHAVDIVLIDRGSDDPESLAALDALAREGIAIHRWQRQDDEQAGRRLQRLIKRHFRRWGEPVRFAVATDEVDFSVAAPDALALYDEMLDRFRDAPCVGPMLRVGAVPRQHAAFAQIMNEEIAAHRRQPPSWCETGFGRVAFVQSTRLGSFALHRCDAAYFGPEAGLRVHYPFEARNIDWETPGGGTDADEPLQYASYYAVERGADGVLAAVAKPVIAE